MSHHIQINQSYLSETLSSMVSIPSTNPQMAADGTGETRLAQYLLEQMGQLGMEARLVEPQPGRASALGVLRGSGGGRSLMLNGHIDTVGIEGMPGAFQPEIRDGKLYGRGAQDMKGSLAASLAAVKALVESGRKLKGDLWIAAVSDEEYASLGTYSVIEVLRREKALPDGAIVTEPTELQIAAAHRGFAWLEVHTTGRPAHGSRWWEGVDANRMMGRVLVGIDALASELTSRSPHLQVGPPSLHTPVIQGGSEVSIYAASCKLQIERRTVPGESDAQVQVEIQAVLDRLAQADPVFKASLKLWFSRPAFEARPDSDLLPALQRARGQVLGEAGQTGGVAFWTDAALLAEAGVDTLLIGPVGAGLHTPDEHVDLESCRALAEILALAAEGYCG